jgi:hypothetical protein
MDFHLALEVVSKLLVDFALDPAATSETTKGRDQTRVHGTSQ